jgi:hypothetical protein
VAEAHHMHAKFEPKKIMVSSSSFCIVVVVSESMQFHIGCSKHALQNLKLKVYANFLFGVLSLQIEDQS